MVSLDRLPCKCLMSVLGVKQESMIHSNGNSLSVPSSCEILQQLFSVMSMLLPG